MSVDNRPAAPRRTPLAVAAKELALGARRGILATLTAEDGFPYGSLVEFAVLPDGDIVLLLSRLAEHQHYLERDGRASLVIAPSLLEENAMAKPRVTLVGRAEPVTDRGRYAEIYVQAHPGAARYLGFADFQFYRLHVERVRYIAGFGQMGWIKGEAYRDAFAQA